MFEIGIFSVIVLAVSYWAVLWVMGRREDVLHGEFVKGEAEPGESARATFPSRRFDRYSLHGLFSRNVPRFPNGPHFPSGRFWPSGLLCPRSLLKPQFRSNRRFARNGWNSSWLRSSRI
jgi:hypothetical protein